MRFETRFDRWLVVLLILGAIVSGAVLPAIRFLAADAYRASHWLSFAPLVIWIVVLASTLPQYYEVRDDGLFIRQGWRKSLIPYASLEEVQAVSDARSAGVFSTYRILVVTRKRNFVIAVAEEERFLAELFDRSPQLKRRAVASRTSFGLLQ